MRLPFWGTILTILGVGILCGLGFWQLERLQWKEGLIAKLDAAYESNADKPLDLTQDFSYGRVDGILLADKAVLVGPRTRDGQIGSHVLAPLAVGDQTLLVNIGWTARDDLAALSLPAARVAFTGLLRAPEWNAFTPVNDPASDLWYRLDPLEIAAAKGLGNPAPYVLYAEMSDYDFNGIRLHTDRRYPNNNHLQYAFFWFAMAAAMVGVYVARFVKKA